MNKELKTWHFGINNDKLVDLVLEGKKQLQQVYIMVMLMK